MCGYVADSDKWWTQEQLESMREIATSYALNMIQSELDKSFKKLERSTRNNKYFKIKYKPGRRISFITQTNDRNWGEAYSLAYSERTIFL